MNYQTNICIPGYHRFSLLLGCPIYYANQGAYLLMLLATSLGLWTIIIGLATQVQLTPKDLIEKILIAFKLLYVLWTDHSWFFSCITGLLMWAAAYWTWHALVFVYAISSGLTLDELYRPHKYPYLFLPSKIIKDKYRFDNKNDLGAWNNWCDFFGQLGSPTWTRAMV